MDTKPAYKQPWRSAALALLLLMPHLVVAVHVATAHHGYCCGAEPGTTVHAAEDNCPICTFQFVREYDKTHDTTVWAPTEAWDAVIAVPYLGNAYSYISAFDARGPPRTGLS